MNNQNKQTINPNCAKPQLANRLYKFRAWDKKQKYMAIQGTPDLETLQSFMFHFGEDFLMQFTGLIDKNGKEIYEGDIITWKETRFHTQEQIEKKVPMPKMYKSLVFYEDGGFIVSADQDRDTPLCCFFNNDSNNKFDYKATVIGNIFENPELLQTTS